MELGALVTVPLMPDLGTGIVEFVVRDRRPAVPRGLRSRRAPARQAHREPNRMSRDRFEPDPQLALAMALLVAWTPFRIAWNLLTGKPWRQ